MKVGICGPVAKAAKIRAAGADFFEENVQKFLVAEAPDSEFEEKLAAASGASLPVIAANCFIPGALKCVGPERDMPRLVRYAETALKRAGRAGIEAIVFGSGGSRRVPDGFSREEATQQMIEFAKQIAPAAQTAGVVLVIEPLNSGETNLVNSLAEGARIVEAVGHESVRLLADVFHMLRDGEDPGEIVKYGGLLRHAHIAEKEVRSAPGVKGDDFKPYFDAFKAAGYGGPISIECRWGEDFDAEAKRAVDVIRAGMA